MKSRTGWILVIVLGLALLFFLPFLLMGGYGGMMGPGMMGFYGYMNPLGSLIMAVMWLIPIGAIVLIIFAAVGLFSNKNNVNKSLTGISLPGRTCHNCGKPAQTDWKTCPYCGHSL